MFLLGCDAIQLLTSLNRGDEAEELYRAALALDWGGDGVSQDKGTRRMARAGFHHNLGALYAARAAAIGNDHAAGHAAAAAEAWRAAAIQSFTSATELSPLLDSFTEVTTGDKGGSGGARTAWSLQGAFEPLTPMFVPSAPFSIKVPTSFTHSRLLGSSPRCPMYQGGRAVHGGRSFGGSRGGAGERVGPSSVEPVPSPQPRHRRAEKGHGGSEGQHAG